jgi:hypothetical protein
MICPSITTKHPNITQDTHEPQFEIQSHIEDSPSALPIYPSSKFNSQ